MGGGNYAAFPRRKFLYDVLESEFYPRWLILADMIHPIFQEVRSSTICSYINVGKRLCSSTGMFNDDMR